MGVEAGAGTSGVSGGTAHDIIRRSTAIAMALINLTSFNFVSPFIKILSQHRFLGAPIRGLFNSIIPIRVSRSRLLTLGESCELPHPELVHPVQIGQAG